jgi:hypothetical protein
MSPLSPTTKALLSLPAGRVVEIPKCETSFSLWSGAPVNDNYGGKPVVEQDGSPLFVELAVLRTLEKEGWAGVWVDSYRRCLRKDMPPSKVPDTTLGDVASEIFNTVTKQVGKSGGCWDVLAWKAKDILFVECKRRKKDAIQVSQLVWLEQCLNFGLQPENFLIVEWDLP